MIDLTISVAAGAYTAFLVCGEDDGRAWWLATIRGPAYASEPRGCGVTKYNREDGLDRFDGEEADALALERAIRDAVRVAYAAALVELKGPTPFRDWAGYKVDTLGLILPDHDQDAADAAATGGP